MQAVACKTPHFSIPLWSSSVEFGITPYYNPDWLLHATSQDTNLSCHVLNSTMHHVIRIHQCYR